MAHLFNVILYQPILNLLVFIYNIIPGHDIGLAIIVLTIIIRLALYPLTNKSIKSQKDLQTIQPKLKALQEKYKNDKTKLASATMNLYRENKVSPFSSCLPLLIQFPILIAVYQVLRTGLVSKQLQLYSFVANPGFLNPISLGFLNLSKPNLVLALITGLAQYWQAQTLSQQQPPATVRKSKGAKDENMMAVMNKQMKYMMPIFTVLIGISLPSGLISNSADYRPSLSRIIH